MNVKSRLDKETLSLEKIKLIQLPNRYKKIGWLLVILGFTTLLTYSVMNVQEGVKIGSKYAILLGLLVVSISREIIEDERIKSIRMQSYSIAFLVAVLYAFIIPSFVYLVDKITGANPKFEDVGDFVILWILLAIQIFSFNIKKRHSA